MNKDKLFIVLDELVSCKGITCTESENITSEYVYNFLKNMEYFKKSPELMGKLYIPDDKFNRFIPYGLVLGNKKDTVIFGGHTDVVTASVYGDLEKYAFNINELEKHLSNEPLSDEGRKDLESGEWIWGRGAADMKAGIALNLLMLEDYSKEALENKLEGSLLFIAVPDEESYSAGMRFATAIMDDFKEKYNLDYKLLLNPEPAAEINNEQVMSLGTVGKTLPVIITQGKLAHIGHYFTGLSGLNMLANIFEKTNGSMKFSDSYKGEATIPPVWASLRDMKGIYDVSLPERGYGYMTVLSFDRTLEEIISEIKSISEKAFDEEIEKLNKTYDEYNKVRNIKNYEKIQYKREVYTVQEFIKILHDKYKDEFEKFYRELYAETGKRIHSGEDYPKATVYMMNELLNFSGIKTPLILIGVAPPYYPPTHSDMIKGREGFGTKVFEFAKKISEEEFNQKMTYENYFLGISDNSYTSVIEMDFESLTKNYPMWGPLYSIDFNSIAKVPVPSILYGPISKEYHQWTERVNKRSLFEVMPFMIKKIIEFAWNN